MKGIEELRVILKEAVRLSNDYSIQAPNMDWNKKVISERIASINYKIDNAKTFNDFGKALNYRVNSKILIKLFIKYFLVKDIDLRLKK